MARNVRVEVVRKVPRNAVLVDLDGFGEEHSTTIRERLLLAGYRVRSMEVIPSRRHVHAIVRVWPTPKSLLERIALQLLCGSDPNREAHNLRRLRVLSKMPKWARMTANVLYER